MFMPRHARLRLPGLPLHVIQRGVNRAACFRSDRDRRRYLALLADAAMNEGCKIHAFVLMTNHVHLLLSPEERESASRMMKSLGERYVPEFNRRHQRTGTLWEGRFRSSVVDTERYFMECQRYIELNPVRADIVLHPREYPWSSYRTNAEGRASRLVTPHACYLSLASTEQDRRAAYQKLFAGSISKEELRRIRASINSGAPLGDGEFVAALEREAGRTVARGIRVRLPAHDGAGI
jgi:putative transposase